jgi:NitT/TauT family transport system substrate-binding protein
MRTLFFLVFLIFILAGCLSSDSPSKEEAIMELDTVKVMVLPYLSFAPFFIANEEGYFAEQRMEVEFIKFGSPVQAMPVLAQGELDVATGGVTSSLFNSISRGVNIRIVADKGHLDTRCTYAGMLVNKELFDNGEIKEISQLKGNTLALEDFGGWGYVYSEILSSEGLNLDDIESIFLRPPDRVGALAAKSVAAAQLGEPFITKLIETELAEKLVGYEEFLPDFQLAYIVYGSNLLEKDREIGKRFMVAYLKGVKQYNEGKTERNIDIIQNYTKEDRGIIERACWPSIHSDGHLNTQSLLDVQDWSFENGYVDELVTEYQLFDKSFIEYANEVLS